MKVFFEKYIYDIWIFILNLKQIHKKIYYKMGIGDWGLGIGDWGLGPIPNPQIIEIKKFFLYNLLNLDEILLYKF